MLASSATLGLLLLALVVGMTPASTSEATSRIVVTAEAEADFARASAAALAARYPLPAAAGHDEVQVGADSSCSFLPGVAYQSHNLPANVIKVPSSTEGRAGCAVRPATGTRRVWRGRCSGTGMASRPSTSRTANSSMTFRSRGRSAMLSHISIANVRVPATRGPGSVAPRAA